MSDQIVLTLPEELSARVKRIAESTSTPVEDVLLQHLRTLSTPVPQLPPDEQAELQALHHLSDDALWTIAREQMPGEAEKRAHELMDKNERGLLDAVEQRELENLVERADRLMLRKAQAAYLLKNRGYTFAQQDFSP